MKKVYTLALCLFLLTAFTQAQYITRNFSFDSVNRQYILYIPVGYDSTQPHAFVIALHGLGDNMANFRTGINMKPIADTAQFIFAVPQALVDAALTGSSAWNSGAGYGPGFTLNPDVDDVGFLNALMDTVSAQYNIDQTRIYATGFSMGGFMSNRLACELNNRVAAIASVSGTIGKGLSCSPGHAIPVAHFHGTADTQVSFTANQFGNNPEDLVKYWADNNGCDTTAIIDSLPDTRNDGKTVIRYKYLNGSYDTEVEFYKVIGGAHEWLASSNDITYSVEIWRFFSRFQWTDQISGISNAEIASSFSVHPNPANSSIMISVDEDMIGNTATITDITGRKMMAVQLSVINNQLSIEDFANGIYFATIHFNGSSVSKKIVISR